MRIIEGHRRPESGQAVREGREGFAKDAKEFNKPLDVSFAFFA